MWDTEETICAIASPPGPAERGVVRVSGPKCVEIICRIVDSPTAEQLRTAKKASVWETELDLGQPLGTVHSRLLLWPGRRSYTGQPSAELHLCGAAPLLQATLARLHDAGARLARPGEFTLRSFLAGRIDLTQAEAVLGVIDADSQAGLGPALDQLTGGISQPLSELRSSMIDLLADVEAGLDFADEDIQFIEDDVLAQRLDTMSLAIKQTLEKMSSGGRSGDVPVIVLCGKPNAGKSSLLNTLAGFESAIVSSTVGTTRDPVEVRLTIGETRVRVIDTAGLEKLAEDGMQENGREVKGEGFGPDESLGSIEFQAQDLGQRLAADADVRIWCASLEHPLEGPPEDLAKDSLNDSLRVATKSDLVLAEHAQQATACGWLPISSKTGIGLLELTGAIEQKLNLDRENQGVASTAARCRESLSDAADGLASAAEVTRIGGGHELVSAELRLAIDAVGRVTGEVYTEDILDSIFSRFCIGK